MSSFNSLRNTNNSRQNAATPQSQPIPGREEEMVENNAGGFTFTVDLWDRLDRFLILGVEGGTYYVSEKKLAVDNAKNVVKAIEQDGLRVVQRIVEISDSGRAAKNDPALFALALAASADNPQTRQAALVALPQVARIGTHLFHFADFVQNFRGWGRALRRAIGDWYTKQDVSNLAYQAVKYRQRDGWTHRDLLRLSHPKTRNESRNDVFKWIVTGKNVSDVPVIAGFEQAQTATSPKEIVRLINEFNLPREAIPTEFLNDVNVWDALLQKMPLHAMIRNLGKMSSIGLLAPMSNAQNLVVNKLSNAEDLRRSRVHPMAVLTALYTYKSGHGIRGSLSWDVNSQVMDALDESFYGTFQNVEPTGKPTMLALDVSGSMSMDNIGGVPGLTPRVASAAMAMITARTEPNYMVTAFTGGGSWGRSGNVDNLTVLDITPRQRMDDVIRKVSGLSFGGTDCALPMIYADKKNLAIDNFAVYTDNETWAGSIQPSQSLVNYRKKSGRGARLAVVGMTSTDFTIADPKDAGMMDVVGFDSAAPAIMANFFRG